MKTFFFRGHLDFGTKIGKSKTKSFSRTTKISTFTTAHTALHSAHTKQALRGNVATHTLSNCKANNFLIVIFVRKAVSATTFAYFRGAPDKVSRAPKRRGAQFENRCSREMENNLVYSSEFTVTWCLSIHTLVQLHWHRRKQTKKRKRTTKTKRGTNKAKSAALRESRLWGECCIHFAPVFWSCVLRR